MLSSARNSLFTHPKRATAIFGLTSGTVLLILTCIKLTPLGKKQRNAKKNLDAAQKSRDAALQHLNNIEAHIQENEQRIIDLDCAISGYPQFNENIDAFFKKIHASNSSSLDRLASFWKIHFVPDNTKEDRSIKRKSWTEAEHYQELVYTCSAVCPSDQKCCYVLQDVVRETTYYYNEITLIQNIFKNIITGTPLQLPSLDCGYYSRQFKTLSPTNYISHESLPIESGDKRTGTTYIQYSREYGSELEAQYRLDDRSIASNFRIVENTDQDQAAINLAARLYAFLGTAVAAFGATGANYPMLQTSLRQEIPHLINDSIAANATLHQQNILLTEQQVIFDNVDHVFKNNLSLWLSLLFLLPSVTGLFIYFALSQCKDIFRSDYKEPAKEAIQPEDDIEDEVASLLPSPNPF